MLLRRGGEFFFCGLPTYTTFGLFDRRRVVIRRFWLAFLFLHAVVFVFVNGRREAAGLLLFVTLLS